MKLFLQILSAVCLLGSATYLIFYRTNLSDSAVLVTALAVSAAFLAGTVGCDAGFDEGVKYGKISRR